MARWRGGSFRDLIVWQRSVDLTVAVYRLTRGFPREEVYGMTAQMRRAAVSIASNIAEGYGRNSDGEFRYFLGIARGSNAELETQLVVAKRLEFAGVASMAECEGMSGEVARMLTSLMADA